MKNLNTFGKLAFMVLALVTLSCNKDDAPAPIIPPPAAGNGFTWTINGAAASKNTLTASYNLQGTAMNLFATPSGTVFEINLTGSTPGTYNIGGGNGFYYNYSATENLTNPDTGSITITSFANNKASGTFTATGVGVGVTSISGTFSNIGL